MCTGRSPNIRAREATRCTRGVWSRVPEGISLGGTCPGGYGPTPLPRPVRMTDACENITFSQLRWRAVKIAHPKTRTGMRSLCAMKSELSLGPVVNVQRCVVYVRILSCDWISGRAVSPKAIVFPTGDVPFYVTACLEVALLRLHKLKTIICEKIEWRTGWVRSFV